MSKRLILVLAMVVVLVSGLVVSGCASPASPSAGEFPTRDIRVICPWGAGGGCDAVTRKISYLAEQHLPINMYVENIVGGASGLAISQVMNSVPDGYNICSMTYDSVVGVMYRELIPGYDLEKLQFLCRVTMGAAGIMVRSDSPWETLDDLIQEMKRKPGEIRIGVSHIGSMSHIQIIKLEQAAGIDFEEIPFPEGAEGQKAAILAGELAVVGPEGFDDFMDLLDAGELKALAYYGDARHSGYPDVPTLIESGYNVTGGSFVIMATTKGTPPDVIKTLEDTFYKAHQSDEFQDWAIQAGVDAAWAGAEDTKAWALQIAAEEFKLLDTLVEKGLIEK